MCRRTTSDGANDDIREKLVPSSNELEARIRSLNKKKEWCTEWYTEETEKEQTYYWIFTYQYRQTGEPGDDRHVDATADSEINQAQVCLHLEKKAKLTWSHFEQGSEGYKIRESLTDEKNVATVETYVHYYIVYCYYMWLPDYVCL